LATRGPKTENTKIAKSFDSSGNPLHDYKKRSYHNLLAHISKTHFFGRAHITIWTLSNKMPFFADILASKA
jgi:hypothetical protein